MDKLRRMEIFKAVAEAGQFSRAAENLHLSKSAVSHAISDLETYLETHLVTRNTRGFQLTSDGERYYQNCCHILSEVHAFENDFRHFNKSLEGTISLTTPITYGVRIISPLLVEFLKANPLINIDFSLSESNVDLVQAGIDLAIRIGHLSSSASTAHRLTSVSFSLCASPGWIAGNPPVKAIQDLDHVDCLKYRWTPKWNFIHNGKQIAFTPKGSVTSDSGEALREFAIGGHGVCFLPDFIVEDALQSGQLKKLLPDVGYERVPVHAVFPPGSQRPFRVNRLLEFLVDSFNHEQ